MEAGRMQGHWISKGRRKGVARLSQVVCRGWQGPSTFAGSGRGWGQSWWSYGGLRAASWHGKGGFTTS